MRNWRVVLLVIFLISLLALPAAAQEGTIVDVASGNPDFSTLVAAVLAADPSIAEALTGPGPLTVFAPTNQAFDNLLASLNLTADDLLANQELLTTVLLYHVVQGNVLAADVVALDGQAVNTLLPDSAITISVVDGGVVLNEIVNVVQTDIAASNGTIHVIDNVLLPESVLESLGLAAEEPAADTGFVNIQVAHLSPDTPAVDVYVNGDAAITNLEFNSLTDWITLPAGAYDIAVAPAGTSIDQAAIGPASFDLPAGQFLTIAAIGSLEAGTLAPAIIAQDYSPVPEGSARVKLFHAIEDAPAVDVLASGTVLVRQLGFPGTLGDNDGLFVVEVPAGTYDISVVPNGATTPVVISLPGTAFEAGSITFVAATGTLANPGVAVFSANSERAAELVAAVTPAAPAPNLAELVIAATQGNPAEFTILLAAVQAADPAILAALTGPDPLTVFAPTDAAFTALLAQLGLTAEELLAQPDLVSTVLLYHVVSGAVPASTVVTLDGQSVPTLQGESVAISIVNGGVVLNGTVNVIQTDLTASNGIVHVIDAVLVPQAVLATLG
jgi:transforming growth factor-beta-induced protein